MDDIEFPTSVSWMLDEELKKRLGQIDPSQVDQAQRDRIRIAASGATAAVLEETRSYRADWERAVTRYLQDRDVAKQAWRRVVSSFVLMLLVAFGLGAIVLVVRYQSVSLAYTYFTSISPPTFVKVASVVVVLPLILLVDASASPADFRKG